MINVTTKKNIRNKRTSGVSVEKLGAALGAEISNVDLSIPIPTAAMTVIQKAFVEHGLLIFRNQDLTQEEYLDFGRHLGELVEHIKNLITFKVSYAPNVFGRLWANIDQGFFINWVHPHYRMRGIWEKFFHFN